jgi:hypothetical protein
MRRVSKTRAKRNREVKQWREDLRREVGRCEKCLKPAANLDVHELVPGNCRALALDKRFAVLCLHRLCHNALEAMTIPRQLAYLLRARPEDFQMEQYWELIGRRWPDIEDIQVFYDQLKSGDA